MAITAQSGSLANWWLAYRSGTTPTPTGTVYNGLVSDLAVGDYLVGARAEISATGATTGTSPNQVRSLTLQRLGHTWTVSWPISSTVQFIR